MNAAKRGQRLPPKKPQPHQPSHGPAEAAAPQAAPLRPRRGLFLALLATIAAWAILLLVMYLTTVYPQRQEQPPTAGLHFQFQEENRI